MSETKQTTAELTTAEVAARLGVTSITVRQWCRQGRFPNAREQATQRGPVWLIPETDLKGFELPKSGRPPKPKDNDQLKDRRKALKQKAIERWEGEGGATVPAKQAGKKGGKK